MCLLNCVLSAYVLNVDVLGLCVKIMTVNNNNISQVNITVKECRYGLKYNGCMLLKENDQWRGVMWPGTKWSFIFLQ